MAWGKWCSLIRAISERFQNDCSAAESVVFVEAQADGDLSLDFIRPNRITLRSARTTVEGRQ